jgi:2-methylcitrate dehydratase PrpD
MAAGMSSDADPAKLIDGLGTRWATAETSFKYHASCRHTHPAADALLQVMQANKLVSADIAHVITHVHQGAIDVLGPVINPATVHQSKFSMGTVLALVARFGHAGLVEFDQHFQEDLTVALCNKVVMQLDAEVDAAYPRRWIGKVTVITNDGRALQGRVDDPKGDPGNTLSRDEITAKVQRLAAYSGGGSESEMSRAMAALWAIAQSDKVGPLLGATA